MKNIYFIIVALFLLFYVIHIVRRGKLSIKESFWWVIGALVALVLAIFPKSIDVIAKWFGVSYPPTLMFVFCICTITGIRKYTQQNKYFGKRINNKSCLVPHIPRPLRASPIFKIRKYGISYA